MKQLVLDLIRSKHLDRKGREPRIFSPLLCVALVIGLIAHLIGFIGFRVTTKSLPQSNSQAAFLKYTANNSLDELGIADENALLFDSAPLFIPTKWNAAQNLFTDIKTSGRT